MKLDRSEVLRRANQHVSVDRAATHGSAENNFENIAVLWSWWLDRQVTAHDVAMMMGLFKDARIKSNPAHADSYEDGCGYRAIAAEIAVPSDPDAAVLADSDTRLLSVINGYAGMLSPDARADLARNWGLSPINGE